MLFLLLLGADPVTGPVEAERAFAKAAQARGQWTAFREFMADDAILFTPQEAKAKEAMPDKNPGIPVQWWPASSHVSCDGSAAVNTGPWVLPKSSGYFTTVWVRQSDGGWKWAIDGGDTLERPRALPEKPAIRKASCARPRAGSADAAAMTAPARPGHGKSADGTLLWDWEVKPDGARTFTAWLWNGRRLERVIHDQIGATTP